MSHTETADVSRYTYRVTWSVEDDEFVATCAEFPSLSWLADSQPAALQGQVQPPGRGKPPPPPRDPSCRRAPQPQPVRRATPLRGLLSHLWNIRNCRTMRIAECRSSVLDSKGCLTYRGWRVP